MLQWIFFFKLLIICFQTGCPTVPVKDYGQGFERKQCSQDDRGDIVCQNEGTTDKGDKEEETVWPPGPFVLPMSIFGCPESYKHGWREGYLSIIWNQSTGVYVSRGANSSTDINWTEHVVKLKQSAWPTHQTITLGPFSEVGFKLNFCYKQRENGSLDKGVWPNGTYDIYADENGCPYGFTEIQQNISLPAIVNWTSDCHTPSFRINEQKDSALLQMRLCTYDTDKFYGTDESSPLSVLDTPFVLLQHEGRKCPVVSDLQQRMLEETVFLEKASDTDTVSTLQQVQTFCYNIPRRWNKIENVFEAESNDKIEHEYYMTPKYVQYGNKSVLTESDDTSSTAYNNMQYFFQQIVIKHQHTIIPWVLIDLARSMSVSGLQIVSSKDKTPKAECFISEEKWAFLHFSALSCPHESHYDHYNGHIDILFKREMDGRYVALVSILDDEGDFYNIDDTTTSFRIFTKHLYQSSNMCNMALGMADGSIRDDQISVSTEQPLYTVAGVRPYHTGWCASVRDPNHTVTVDLLTSLKVEGLIIWNWSEKITVQGATAVIEQLYILGAQTFVIYYGDAVSDLRQYHVDFQFDKSRPYDQAQTFLLKTPVQARFIQIRILEPFTNSLNCIRFELLGCTSPELFQNPRLHLSLPEQSINTVVKSLTEEAVINSIGSPSYIAGQTYSWIVQFKKFVKVIVTHISLNKYEVEDFKDIITFSSTLFGSTEFSRIVDNRLNGYQFQIETHERLMVITFQSCLASSMQLEHGSGFQAITTSQDIPACFRLESEVDWAEGRDEVCKETTMMLTSMTFLGLPFRKTTEIWTIHVPSQRIHVKIIEFQISCRTNDLGSEFKIIDAAFEKTYCNVKRPPGILSSASDKFIISFFKDIDLHIMYTEGFRASYNTTIMSVESDIDYETPHSEVTNVAVGKPSVMSSIYLLPASLSNDGVIHPDSWSWTCANSDLEYEPWWLVNLEAVYILDRVVVNNRRDCVGCARRTENIEVSVGVTLSSMTVTGYQCGIFKATKFFPQFGARARYVKVQLKNVVKYMNLCEVEVYGVLDTLSDDEFDTKFTTPHPVNGNWGSWGEWSVICTKHKERRRKRQCNNPSPNFHGNICEGNDTSYMQCTPSNTYQENIQLGKPVTFSSRDVSNSTCYKTSYEDYPWIMIDLLDQYHLNVLTVNNFMDVSNLVILTGQTSCNMKERYFTGCGVTLAGVVDLTGVTARFIKLQVMEEYRSMYFCGLSLSGEKVVRVTNHISNESSCGSSPVDTSATSNDLNVNKQWSSWSNCSAVCGIGTRLRTRPCNNNVSDSSGASCRRMDTEYRTCKSYDSCLICSKRYDKCYNIIPELTNWRHAGHECWRRRMKLISLNSLDELRFVKQLLRRETQYTRDRPSVTVDSLQGNTSYFTHIGVHRVLKKNHIVLDYSEDYRPIIFSAWKSGEPSNGSCTRMHFLFYNQDNTWESEDCETGLAEYFICETSFETYKNSGETEPRFSKFSSDWHTFPDQQIKTTEYTGTVNVSDVNTHCLYWANLTKNSLKQNDMWWQKFFPKEEESNDDESGLYIYRDYSQGTKYAHNYCRDPVNDGYLGCYTSDGYLPCTFVLPAAPLSATSYHYRGKQNTTYSGKTCQRWDTDVPHVQEVIEYDYKGEPLKDKENYCRDPWDTGYLWCFTTDIDTRWEPCIVKDSSSDRCLQIVKRYLGTLNVTFSGKRCIHWDTYNTGNNISSTIEVFDNYCRDPFDEGFLWCYTDIADMKREPCLVSEENVYEDATIGGFASSEKHTCTNGDLINLDSMCNGKIDCVDLSDETECWKTYTKHFLLNHVELSGIDTVRMTSDLVFQCDSLEWISLLARCDSVIDCVDASDEIGCSYLTQDHNNCLKDEFRCNAGDCIHISQVCDFIVDCTDASDEYCEMDFCDINEYKCSNGQCIPTVNRCDAYVHCLDGSDEQFCDTCNEDKAFHCDIVRCIPNRLVCDKYTDCVDRSDETSCMERTYSSCEQWWNKGFRETGPYVISGIDVICDFDSIYETNVICTIFNNIDLIWYNETQTGNMYVRESKRESDASFVETFATGNCTQEIKQSCDPVHEAIESYNTGHFIDENRECMCAKQVITKPTDITNETCSGNISDGNELAFMYKLSGYFRTVKLLSTHKNFYQINVGNLTCVSEYHHTEDGLICENDVKVIPRAHRCVYDEDAAGFITGCRSRSHLENCENIPCPLSTVKCPGSFCIPIRFICDGEIQCPGGEDEDMYGCNATNNEILILVYQKFYNSHRSIVDNFAKQFYNLNNIVRILSYETKRPLVEFSLNKIQLQINDLQLQPYDVVHRIEDCEYRIMAEHVIHSLRFSKTASKGIIFFDTGLETKNVAKEMFGSVSYIRHDLTIYRIREMPNIDINVMNDIPHVTDVVIRRWKTLTAIGAGYFSQLCTATSVMHIPKSYKCSLSKTFILSSQVCDGAPQCIHGDDERLCNFRCPKTCKCRGYSVDCSDTNFDMHRIESVPKVTRLLDMSYNKALNSITEKSHLRILPLIRLNLSRCGVEKISPFAFHNVRHLLTLDLSFNIIKILRKSTFEVLTHLTELNMIGNVELTIIESNAFSGLKRIHALDLARGRFKRISAYTFSGLSLEYLDLSGGSIEQIEPLAFNDLTVETIKFNNNNITSFHQEIFNGVFNLKELRTPAYKFCCVRPSYMKEEDCYPTKDEFSSCEDLMRLPALQTMLWFLGLTAFFGNLLSIIYRLIYDQQRLRIGFGIFVTNLAAADFLMSVYLIIIAVADAAFRNRYIYMDDYWRSSAWCKLAGVLSTISSEASILFICLITIDRLLVVKYPLGQIRFDKIKACLAAAFAWVFSVVVAVIPVVYVSYFQDKFYSRSGVCVALPLTRDRPPGWMYSVAIFVGLNFATFVLVAFGQWLIFSEIQATKIRSAVLMRRRQKDLKVARNLLLVVATDFLCWFPIGVMGMMALRGHAISGDVYAWSAVFLLPINSALNPVLYTVTAILGKKKFAPSSDEQTRSEVIGELGLLRLKTFKVGRYFHDLQRRQAGAFLSISTILDRDISMTYLSIIKICIRLAECLDVLHNGSMVIGNLNMDKVLVYVKNNQIVGDVRLRGQPSLQNTHEDSSDDIYQMGILIRSLYKCKRLTLKADSKQSYWTRL